MICWLARHDGSPCISKSTSFCFKMLSLTLSSNYMYIICHFSTWHVGGRFLRTLDQFSHKPGCHDHVSMETSSWPWSILYVPWAQVNMDHLYGKSIRWRVYSESCPGTKGQKYNRTLKSWPECPIVLLPLCILVSSKFTVIGNVIWVWQSHVESQAHYTIIKVKTS